MASMVILVASLMVTPTVDNQIPAITTEKHVFTQGFNPMASCRKLEASYHNGQGPTIKRGNKIVSRAYNPSNQYVYETTTFCVEI